MGVTTKRQKEEAKKQLPTYIPSDEERDWYMHCVRSGIIISPVGILNKTGEWHIGISSPNNHKTVHKSPEICDRFSVWEVFYKYCKYYYDKK